MMRRIYALAFGLALTGLPARALDVVGGNINTNTKWTTADSPVRILGDVTVAPQATLTIDPGVVVQAASGDGQGAGNSTSKVEFVVKGALVANGTATNPIIFRGALSGRDTWYGILFDVGSQASQLSNAQISDTTTAVWSRSGARITLSDLTIRSTTIGVLWQTTAAAILDRVDIAGHQQYGIRLEDDGVGGMTATVTGAVVQTGSSSAVGIHLAPRVNATIKRSRMVMNSIGLRNEGPNALTLVNDVFAGNYAIGAELVQAGTSAITVLNNTFDRNQVGTGGVGLQIDAVTSASSFIVRNNIVTNQVTGVKVAGSTQPSLDANDVWNNSTANYAGCSAGANSISANPLFVQPLGTLPSNPTWVSVNLPTTCSWSNTCNVEAPLAGAIRLRGVTVPYNSSSNDKLYLADRSGTRVQTFSVNTNNATSSAVMGNLASTTLYSYYSSSATSASWAGYDYVALTYNYRLQPSSPAIDVGNNLAAPTEDGDGTPRPYDGDVNGTATVDMGAYEFHSNISPSVDAGSDQTVLPNTQVTFDGSASRDPDGRIVSYDWDFGDGSQHATTAVATHTYASTGSYTARLTVTDDQGASASDTAVVTVASNLPPVANAGPNQYVQPGATVTFDGGQSSDPDGTIVTYSWDFGDGTPAGSGKTVTHVYSRVDIFTVTLTVTDNRGATATGKCSVSVATSGGGTTNQPPVARPGGPYSAQVGQTIAFDGSASSDADGTIASYAWDFGDGQTGTGAKPSHTYAQASTYLVRLTVTDNKGATGTDTVLASVIAQNNQPPVAKAGGPYAGSVGQTILFDGSGSKDADGSIAAWHWDFGDGQTADGDKVGHSFAAGGSYLVRLTVTDNKGASDDDAVLATVSVPGNQPPVAKAGGNRSAKVGENIPFDAAGSSDPDGRITAFLWDFGDGQTATTQRATHAYAEQGSYLVKLTVTDDKGAIGQDIALVSVGSQGNKPPVAQVTPATISKNAGERITFNGSGSTDPDGSIVAYQWDFGDGASAAGVSAVHAYADGGEYVVTLTVFDDKGARATSTAQAVINALPVADAGGDRTVQVGEESTFDASASSDADGSIASYGWTFGDGAKADGETASHAWKVAGTFTVVLTVTDDKGAKAESKIKVTVTAAPQTPATRADSGGCSSTGSSSFALAGLVLAFVLAPRRRRA